MPRLTLEGIDRFFASIPADDLRASRMGIERECLRLTDDGALATSDHPAALGSALSHPFITTDYSEALLEFVTPPYQEPWEVGQFLCDLHSFTHENIADEMLWPLSMPCAVSSDADVPLARYGTSNVGLMKTAYRRGLGHRYGRVMQTIAGVHYNYSPSDGFWRALAARNGKPQGFSDFKSAGYFALVRNFRRLAWMILYLYGASPAVCASFLQRRDHGLEKYDDETFYLPYATSLRMSNLGYSSSAQAELNISLNSLEEYVAGLRRAISTPYPPYQKIGVEVDGQWRQLSANILQIANEYYSVVRPKRTTGSGEKPTTALCDRGVEYVEIRALDISPFDPIGVNQMQMRFMEAFLLYCAVRDSDVIGAQEQAMIERNQALVARRGREPGLTLERPVGDITLSYWAERVCDNVAAIATHLDSAYGDSQYSDAVAHCRRLACEPQNTPSAQLLDDMRDKKLSHSRYGLEIARQHKQYFQELNTISTQTRSEFTRCASKSLQTQKQIEESDRVDFATYLNDYFRQP